MGPRFCKRGNNTPDEVQASIEASLQWGHAFVSVETYPHRLWRDGQFKLQWGHAFVSVETRRWATPSSVVCFASMGPRFCKRGNRVGSAMQYDFHLASMGPRFCKRGNSTTLRRKSFNALLQWGHAFVSVETPARARARARATLASMGPRFCKRGNGISHRGASIPPFLAPAARSGATSAYFGRLGRDFAGHFPARRASSPL